MPAIPVQALVVEDESIVALDIERTLKQLGYGVSGIAETGEQAVQQAEQSRPDLVLMDIRLRGQMDGIAAARHIWERWRIPIIFLTAYADESTLQRAKQAEPFGYLLKPFDDRDLHTAIEMALRKHSTERLAQERAEETLRQTEEHFRCILDNTPLVVFLKDLTGRNLLANRGLQRLLNRRREEIEGKTNHELLPKEFADGFEAHDRQVVASGQAVQFEEQVPQSDGIHTWLSEKFPLRNAQGQIYAVCGVATDITARKRAEEELRQLKEQLEQRVQQRTAELRETVEQLQAFSYTLSHDLRAPLRAIHNFTAIARSQSQDKLEPATLELLDRVLDASRRMDRLIQDVLALTRVSRQDVTLGLVNVEQLVRELVQERPELQPPQAEVRIEGPLLPMWGHALSMSQCLTNLLSNAVKFVAPGIQPQVRVWTELRPSAQVAAPASCFVRLWIEDNGIGIPPEAQGKIFGIFERLHKTDEYEGTGIGLAIVRKAAERMGGRVGVESEPGKGSRFWMELPAAERPVGA